MTNAKDNILKFTMNKHQSIANEIKRELIAEEEITGSSHVSPSVDRPKAIITGSSSGIGRGTAFLLAKDGYDICITYLDEEDEARSIQDYIQEEIGASCHILHLDVSKTDTLHPFIKEATKRLGGLDLLVNNAGIGIREDTFETKEEGMDKIYEVNFKGPILLLQEAAKIMQENGTKGSIVNISSIHATHADEKDATYGSLKSALNRATMSYALQYAEFGIRVNTIMPGAILIDKDDDKSHHIEEMKKLPLSRSGLPRDIAHAVAFFASERASYITGVSLHVDGGMALMAYM